MNEITLSAKISNLNKVLDFINTELKEYNCSMKTRMQAAVAAEEIFVNIANYAYGSETGLASVKCEVNEVVTIEFTDSGTPYNPLKKTDPDITLSAEEREAGGLGIFMVKQCMDSVGYEYKDGKNILTIKKKL